MAQSAGLQQRDVAQSLLVASSGSFQTSPTFYLDPRNGVEYSIAAQSPQYELDTLQDLKNIPVTAGSGGRRLAGKQRLVWGRPAADRYRSGGWTPDSDSGQSRLRGSGG